jgi:hypothetical protein
MRPGRGRAGVSLRISRSVLVSGIGYRGSGIGDRVSSRISRSISGCARFLEFWGLGLLGLEFVPISSLVSGSGFRVKGLGFRVKFSSADKLFTLLRPPPPPQPHPPHRQTPVSRPTFLFPLPLSLPSLLPLPAFSPALKNRSVQRFNCHTDRQVSPTSKP